jgi:hypothetical protein
MSSHGNHGSAGTLQRPVRNRYFFGKKLDVQHFELEQSYFNAKRWLLNRLVSGVGVVCGLNVVWAEPGKHEAILVKPGLAIDKWGRETIVVNDSAPVKVAPPAPGSTNPDEENFIYICIHYLECGADPVPTLIGECDGGQRCMPDSIQERYKISVRPGKAPELLNRCRVPDLIRNDTGEIDYDVMARWVSESCPRCPDDPCIPLAELEFDANGHCINLDITVRPIVYTNDLLFEMILAMTEPQKSIQRGGKY